MKCRWILSKIKTDWYTKKQASVFIYGNDLGINLALKLQLTFTSLIFTIEILVLTPPPKIPKLLSNLGEGSVRHTGLRSYYFRTSKK